MDRSGHGPREGLLAFVICVAVILALSCAAKTLSGADVSADKAMLQVKTPSSRPPLPLLRPSASTLPRSSKGGPVGSLGGYVWHGQPRKLETITQPQSSVRGVTRIDHSANIPALPRATSGAPLEYQQDIQGHSLQDNEGFGQSPLAVSVTFHELVLHWAATLTIGIAAVVVSKLLRRNVMQDGEVAPLAMMAVSADPASKTFPTSLPTTTDALKRSVKVGVFPFGAPPPPPPPQPPQAVIQQIIKTQTAQPQYTKEQLMMMEEKAWQIICVESESVAAQRMFNRKKGKGEDSAGGPNKYPITIAEFEQMLPLVDKAYMDKRGYLHFKARGVRVLHKGPIDAEVLEMLKIHGVALIKGIPDYNNWSYDELMKWVDEGVIQEVARFSKSSIIGITAFDSRHMVSVADRPNVMEVLKEKGVKIVGEGEAEAEAGLMELTQEDEAIIANYYKNLVPSRPEAPIAEVVASVSAQDVVYSSIAKVAAVLLLFLKSSWNWILGATVIAGGAAVAQPNILGWIPTSIEGACVTLMMGIIGMSLRFKDFEKSLEDPGPIVLNFVGAFGMMPVLAWIVSMICGVPSAYTLGMVLVGGMYATPAASLMVYHAKGDTPLSIIFAAMSPLFLGLFLFFSGHGLGLVSLVTTLGICISQIVFPTIFGMTLNKFQPKMCEDIRPWAGGVAVLAWATLVLTTMVRHASLVKADGGPLHVPIVILHVVGALIGYCASRYLGFSEAVSRTTALMVTMKGAVGAFMAQTLVSSSMMAPSAVSFLWMGIIAAAMVTFWRVGPGQNQEKENNSGQPVLVPVAVRVD